MSMTLAPRRRALFNRRQRAPSQARLFAAAVMLIAVASIGFVAGTKMGARADTPDMHKAMVANAQ